MCLRPCFSAAIRHLWHVSHPYQKAVVFDTPGLRSSIPKMEKFRTAYAVLARIQFWLLALPATFVNAYRSLFAKALGIEPYTLVIGVWAVFLALAIGFWWVEEKGVWLASVVAVVLYPIAFVFRYAIVSSVAWEIALFGMIRATVSYAAFTSGIVQLSGFIIGSLLVGYTTSAPLLVVAILLLLGFLSIHFFFRLKHAFSPKLQALEIIEKATTRALDDKLDDPRKPKTRLAEAWVYERMAERFRNLATSHRLVGYYMLGIIYSSGITVFAFALMYLGLSKINPGSFVGTVGDSFSHYLFYSVATLFPAHAGDFGPGTIWAMVLIGTESFLTWVILGLLVSRLTAVKGRYEEEVGPLSEKLNQQVTPIKEDAAAMNNISIADIETKPLSELWSKHDSIDFSEVNSGDLDDETSKAYLSYVDEMQAGADLFNKARNRGAGPDGYAASAEHFRNAAKVLRDVIDGPNVEFGEKIANAKLNEAYALINAGDQPGAIPPLEQYIETSDSIGADQYTLLGQLYLTNDRTEGAIPVLEEGAEVYPENSDIQSLLLNAYNSAGMQEEGIEAYRAQVEQDPDNATYRYNLGSLLLNLERYDQALEQLTRAVELAPQNPKPQYNLGAAYLNKAIDVNEQIRDAESQLASVQMPEHQRRQIELRIQQLASGRRALFEKSVEPLEKTIDLMEASSVSRSDLQAVYDALHTAYVQCGQMDEAKDLEQRLVSAGRDDIEEFRS